MKKLIVVLAIAIVLVGAVFATTNNSTEAQVADGTAAIDVKCVILEAVPVFQLKIASPATVIGAAADAVDTDTTPTATLVSDLTAGNVTVNFEINQIAKANLKAKYSITASASRLELTKFANDEDAPASLVSTQYFMILNSSSQEVASINPAISKDATTNALTGIGLVDTTGALEVEYDGQAQVGTDASADSPLTLGTFSVTWKQNSTAVAGEYHATVSIQVTSI